MVKILRKSLLVIIVISSFCLSSCKEKSSGDRTPTPTPFANRMIAFVNSTSFTAQTVTPAFPGGTTVQAAGVDVFRTINIEFPTTLGVGAVAQFTQNGPQKAKYVATGGVTINRFATSGTIEVLERDMVNFRYKIKFNFVAEDLSGTHPSVNISNGELDVDFN